jgi:hypothetical protein
VALPKEEKEHPREGRKGKEKKEEVGRKNFKPYAKV